MYKLIILWEGGEREEALYATEKEAEEAEKGYYTAFGKQIFWSCIIPTKGEQ